MSLDARPTVAEPDDDPYLWLEDIEGTRALAWVEAENERTLKTFGGAQFAADRDTLAAILDRPDKLPLVVRRGPWLYNFWLDAKNPRGLWRRTTLESFRLDQPAWEILLDIDALAAAEGKDWIWSGAATRPGTHDRAIVRLSRGGSDAVVLREFDLATQDLREGRLRPVRGQGLGELARSRHAAAQQRLGRRRHDIGLCADGAAVAAWHRRGASAGPLRGAAREHVGRRRASTSSTPRSSSGMSTMSASSTSIAGWRTARAAIGSSSTCRPTSRWMSSRLDGDQAAQGLDGGRQDLARRQPARHPARRVHGRRPRFHRPVRAGRAAGTAGLLLERRTAGAVDPRQPAAGVRGPDTVRHWLGATRPDRLAGDRRGRRLAAGYRSRRKATAT